VNRTDLHIDEGIQYWGENEAPVFTLTTTPWGSSPTGLSLTIEDLSNNETDVTSTLTDGSDPTATGDIVTLPQISGWKRGHRYRVRVAFTAGGTDWEAKATIDVDP